MSSEPAAAVEITGLGKSYNVYRRPVDRLRQFFAPEGRKYYQEHWALRGVDLTVYRGETLGIIGRNGAGKSTLLKMVAGTLRPSEGEARCHGRVTALLELGSGFHLDFTGRENVYVAGAILGIDRAEMARRLPQIEAFAEIGEFLDRPVKHYSKGMFARLSFAVYANLDPDVFIVDEALAVGDARFRHKCITRFQQMQQQGKAILYVSHDVAAMKHQCDRVAWIDAGRLRMAGAPGEVVDRYLTELFHGEANQLRQPAAAGPTHDRAGTGRCTITGVQLLDPAGAPVEVLPAGAECVLLIRYENRELPAGAPLQVGFHLRNAKGLPVTGTNTELLALAVPAAARGQPQAVRFRLRLPQLAAGSYSCTASVSERRDGLPPLLCDRLHDALVARAEPDRQVVGVVGLSGTAELEP